MVTRVLGLILLLASPVLSHAPASATGFFEEVTAFTTHDGLTIECILSSPADAVGPAPGMLLIAGSGLHDADVTLDEPTLTITRGPQKLFRTLARHFSREGWAVLRCNKRGASFDHVSDQPSILERSTLDDLLEDARNALRTLHQHPRVAARPLAVYGHSEGSILAARLAEEQREIDLVILVGTVGRPMTAILEYQLVDRNLVFFRQAADANGDGALTLDELDSLDGNSGLDSIYVSNCAEVLFNLSQDSDGALQVEGLNSDTDVNRDGALEIAAEIEPALRREARRLLALIEAGDLGAYLQSLLAAKPTRSFIHQLQAPILFVHGALDVQAPVGETRLLIDKLEARGRADYELLVFPRLGHALSKPNDYFKDDGGLTVLDNLTLNTPKKRVRSKLLDRIEANLPD